MLTYAKDCCQLVLVGSSYEMDVEIAFKEITTSPEFLHQYNEGDKYLLLYNNVTGVQDLFKIKTKTMEEELEYWLDRQGDR